MAIPFPLARLPTELRVRIYDLAFGAPRLAVDLSKLYLSWQDWIYEPTLSFGNITFYPQSLKRVPSDLRAEALAVAYKHTYFKATAMDQIIRLYGLMGAIGRENLQNLFIDWVATTEVNFAEPSRLEFEDRTAIQAFSLLGKCARLRHLTIELNGYAFTHAYVSNRQRRLKSIDPDLTGEWKLAERIYDVPASNGTWTSTNYVSIGDVLLLPDETMLWKVGHYLFVRALRREVAECDPVLCALRAIRGLKTFMLTQPDELLVGVEKEVKEWLTSEMTKPSEDEQSTWAKESG